jgi:hypothetical protein
VRYAVNISEGRGLVINSGGSLALPDCTTDGYVLKWNNRAQAYSCQEAIGREWTGVGTMRNWHNSAFALPDGVMFDVRGGEMCIAKEFRTGITVLSVNIYSTIYNGFYVANMTYTYVVVCLRQGIPYNSVDGPAITYSYINT